MADCTLWTRTVTLMAGEKTIATAQSTCQCEDDPPLNKEPEIGQATFSGWTDTYETCEKPSDPVDGDFTLLDLASQMVQIAKTVAEPFANLFDPQASTFHMAGSPPEKFECWMNSPSLRPSSRFKVPCYDVNPNLLRYWGYKIPVQQ